MDNHLTHVRKNIAYCQSVSAEEQAFLPANPSCGIELTDADLESVYGSRGNMNLIGALDDLGLPGILENPSVLGNPVNPGPSSSPKGSTSVVREAPSY
jgi:mersacidin/lichenicidin family type 2 lantibiotic